jgi:putative endonuclease
MNLYIIQSKKTDCVYIGISKDVSNRLKYHNSGKVKTTKNKGPWRVIYIEKHSTVIEARRREKYLKSYSGCKEKRSIINSCKQ